MPEIEIATATTDDIDALAHLFDGYRVFYGQPSDPDRARGFLLDRLLRAESVVFMARHDGEPVGLVQMFPSFSSVSTARLWILNDLYVAPEKRRLGIARALIEHAVSWARKDDSVRVILETERNNHPAKSLYEALGWKLDDRFDRYSIELGSS